MIHQVKKADFPDLFRILARAGFRRHSATVIVSTEAELHGSYWDGGSKDEHYRMTYTGEIRPLYVRARVPFGDQSLPWTETHKAGDGIAIVTAGTFRGRQAFPNLVIHPDDVDLFHLGPIARGSDA